MPLIRTSWSAFVHPVAYRVHCAMRQRQSRLDWITQRFPQKNEENKMDMGNTLAVKGSTNKASEGM